MAFRYSLQKIVDLKNTEKTQAEWLLSHAIAKLHDEESRLAELHHEQQRLHIEFGSASSGSKTISEIMIWQDYMQYVDLKISRKHSEVMMAQDEVTGKQEQLTDRMLDEKVWNKAKERAYQKFVGLIQRKEQNELDDLSACRRPNLT